MCTQPGVQTLKIPLLCEYVIKASASVLDDIVQKFERDAGLTNELGDISREELELPL